MKNSKILKNRKIIFFLIYQFFSVYIRSKKIPAKFEDDRIKTQGGHELFPPNGKSGPLCAGGHVAPELETIRKVANDKLLVEVITRADVFLLFELSKKSKRGFYVSEQLTRERQAIMYDLRTYLKDKPNLQASNFARNGTPTLKIGSDQPIPIRSQKELDDLIRKIEEN